MEYRPPEPMPDYWLNECKTEEEKKLREHEWAKYQCQRNKDYYRVMFGNILRNFDPTIIERNE